MKTSQMTITVLAMILLLSSVALADVSGPNIALGQPTTASGTYLSFIPDNVFDGDEETYWNAGGYGGHWIEVDLGRDTIIGSMRMMVAQVPNGGTTHLVSGRTESGTTVSLWGHSEYTTNFQWLESGNITNPIPVRYVRILTTTTPSWVAWAEIEIYEGAVVSNDEMTWSGVKALFSGE